MKKLLIAIFFILPQIAFGEIIYTADTNTTVIAGYGHPDRPQSAQSFNSSGGGFVTTISVWMTNENGVADDVVLSLVEDSGGEPVGSVLESTTKDVTGTGCAEYTWTLTGTTELLSSTSYWILFGRDGGTDNYDYGLCGNDPSVYPGGTEADEDSSVWTDKDRDAYTEITLSTTPGGEGTSTATSTVELEDIHYDLLWMLWFFAFACSFVWFERYYKS